MRYMEYGPDDELRDGIVLLGMTAPDLIVTMWGSLLLGLPILGVVVQRKPLVPVLSSWKAFLLGGVIAAVALGVAFYLLASYVFYWAFLFHD